MGTASEKEVVRIEKRLASEAGFVEQVVAFERQLLQNPKTANKTIQGNLVKALQYRELNDLQQFFGGLQFKLMKELNVAHQTPSLQGAIQYSLQQLKEWFMPLPLYEKRIVGVSRGSESILIAPEKNMDCSNRVLEFKWNVRKGGFEEIDLILENNRGEVLLEESLDVHADSYVAILPKEQFLPGRYYWKFCVEEDAPVMGVFFVQKELMPKL